MQYEIQVEPTTAKPDTPTQAESDNKLLCQLISGEVAPEDVPTPDELYLYLIHIVKGYHPSADDLTMIRKAYDLAREKHEGQKRKSGEPYIIHPICVAIILAQLGADKESIIAGILHDIVEDTEVTVEELSAQFGEEITLLVDGVTKLTQLNYSKDKIEIQAENLRKMFLAMAKDIRVIVIKLADRLHNMRTMQFQTPEKQIEKSRETMDIYAPLAHRLGISKVKIELDDLSMKFLDPDIYQDLVQKIASKKSEREQFITEITADVRKHITAAGIEAKIDGRVKHFFSIYKKMVNQDKTLDQIYDLFAVRIIVDTVKDCYAALGVIHEMYKPIPGRFKDYIAMPKPNMYQSLHTTLIGPNGQPFEIQIRTYEMHRTAEYGIAAHWKYKEAADGKTTGTSQEEKLAWLREILEWQRELSDNKEFLSLLKNDLDLFSDSVYCFTPTGDVKTLPAGSTPVDFAYSIHSAVGNKMIGARVNGRLVNIDYVIQNGDQVDIITSQNSKGPSRDWLLIVKSTQAKNKINSWFKIELKEDNIKRGRELILAYCKSKGIQLSELLKPEFMEACMHKYGFHDWDSVYAAVGHGGVKEGQIVNKLQEELAKRTKKEMTDEKLLATVSPEVQGERTISGKSKGVIVVQGLDDLAMHFSKCCSPVPGDEIIGFVTKSRGISIHRTDCINIINLNEDDRVRLIEAEWNLTEKKEEGLFLAEIKIYAYNRNGILLDVSKILTENKINVISMNVRMNKQGIATLSIGFEVKGSEQLQTIITKIRSVESVMDIERTTG